MQHDDPRGSQGFLSARLRIPLQAEAKASRLPPMERRMADPIVRDVDIVVQAGTFGPVETVSQTADGKAFTVIDSATTSGAALPGAVTAAGVNSTVILSGTFNTTDTVTMQTGQTLMGAGRLAVRSPSGRTATLALPGATLSSSGSSGDAILATNGTTISGLTIIATLGGSGNYGIGLSGGASKITISNNNISVTTSWSGDISGIQGGGNSDVIIDGNYITVAGSGTWSAYGVDLPFATNATIRNNTVYIARGSPAAFYLANTFLNAGSTGNVKVTGGVYGTLAAGSSPLGFADGTTYP